jgi:hypothetical protein
VCAYVSGSGVTSQDGKCGGLANQAWPTLLHWRVLPLTHHSMPCLVGHCVLASRATHAAQRDEGEVANALPHCAYLQLLLHCFEVDGVCQE